MSGEHETPAAGPPDRCGEESVDGAIAEFQQGLARQRNYHLLFDCFYEPIQRFFVRRGVVQPEDCQDLTQDTFWRVYRGLESFRREARFNTWLYRIARNVHLRWREQRGRKVDFDTDESPEDVEPVDEEPTPEDDVIRIEHQDVVRRAIAVLPEKMRQCMMLRVVHQASYREIAAVMQITVGAVAAHLAQARQRLRKELEGYLEAGQLEF